MQDNNKLSTVEVLVGKPYPIPNKFNHNAYVHYFEVNNQGQGANLYIGFPNITDFEAVAVRKGSFKFTVVDMDNVAFFLSEITDMPNNLGISDSGFHASLMFDLKEEIPKAIYEEKSKIRGTQLGMTLNIYLIDTATSIVRAIRTTAFSTTFSDKLATLLHKQFDNPIDIEEAMSRINSVHNQYEPYELYKLPNFGCERKTF